MSGVSQPHSPGLVLPGSSSQSSRQFGDPSSSLSVSGVPQPHKPTDELLFASTGRQFDQADLELAEELARRAGTAIDNARLYELARRASKARDDLLAMVSHDLKNPLNSIVLGVEVLMKTLSPGKDQAAEASRRVAARIGRAAAPWVIVGAVTAAVFDVRQPGPEATPAPAPASTDPPPRELVVDPSEHAPT